MKFLEAESAAKALNEKIHVIDGRTVQVEIARNCHIDDCPTTHKPLCEAFMRCRADETTTNNELRTESTKNTGTEFMELNDDCWREILARVQNIDLCSLRKLSESSKNIRLNRSTNEAFARKYKFLNLLSTLSTENNEVKRLLANFGPLIEELSTNGSVDGPNKIQHLAKYCSGTLKKLKLRNYHFDGKETRALKAIFTHLRYLAINSCCFKGDANDLFNSCKSLNSLELYHYTPKRRNAMHHTYPELTHFACISNEKIDNNSENLKSFISRHRKLNSLLLFTKDDPSALLPKIAENCSDLVFLGLCTDGIQNHVQYETAVKSISDLKNLKTIFIRNNRTSLGSDRHTNRLIQESYNVNSLKELHLTRVRFGSETVTALLRLQMLEILSCFGCVNFSKFDSLTKLRRLKELYIMSKEVVTFNLAYMVGHLTDLEKFHLRLEKIVTISNEMYREIVNTRSKLNSTKRTFQLACNDIVTDYRF